MKRLLVSLVLITSVCAVSAEDIYLELVMPATLYGPGSVFSLDADVVNSGGAYSGAELYVALTVGTGDFWFYPSWVQFPPEIDWETADIPAGSEPTWPIIPAFAWPHGAGEFSEATFLGAVLHEGILISNLAQVGFGWTEDPQPTPTPRPTGTPTDTPTPLPPPGGWALIPPGTYLRGSPPEEPGRSPDERQHEVTLTRGFEVMRGEVTRQMWADLRTVQPGLPFDQTHIAYSRTMDSPVQLCSWHEAILFANLMSQEYGEIPCYYVDAAFTIPVDASNYITDDIFWNIDADGYRLPTEAEWEYAARAGATGPFCVDEPDYGSGNHNTCYPYPALTELNTVAWWCATSPGWFADTCASNSGLDDEADGGRMRDSPDMTATPTTTPIPDARHSHPHGSKLPNLDGLYDMHGNVSEWCWDWYDAYSSGTVTDPSGPVSGEQRVVRGGHYRSYASECRSACRDHGIPEERNWHRGFRLVRTAD